MQVDPLLLEPKGNQNVLVKSQVTVSEHRVSDSDCLIPDGAHVRGRKVASGAAHVRRLRS